MNFFFWFQIYSLIACWFNKFINRDKESVAYEIHLLKRMNKNVGEQNHVIWWRRIFAVRMTLCSRFVVYVVVKLRLIYCQPVILVLFHFMFILWGLVTVTMHILVYNFIMARILWILRRKCIFSWLNAQNFISISEKWYPILRCFTFLPTSTCLQAIKQLFTNFNVSFEFHCIYLNNGKYI